MDTEFAAYFHTIMLSRSLGLTT